MGGRIIPGDGTEAPVLTLDSSRALLRYKVARHLAGEYWDAVGEEKFNRLDLALVKPWTLGGDDALRLLEPCGFVFRVDERRANEIDDYVARSLARYPRWKRSDDGVWTKDPGTIKFEHRQEVERVLRDLGWKKNGMRRPEDGDPGADKTNSLLAYAWESVLDMGTKRSAIAGWTVGLSKTNGALALSEVWKTLDNSEAPTVILALRKHLDTWKRAIPMLEPLVNRYGPDLFESKEDKKDKLNYTTPFILVSLDRLKRMRESEPEALAELKERTRNSVVILDELYVVMSSDAQVSKGLREITGRHRVSLSGTPNRSGVASIWAPADWTMGPGSPAWMEYRSDQQGSKKRFEEDFQTFAVGSDGSRKLTSVLRNEQKYYDLWTPIMSRHTRDNPEVVRTLGEIKLEVVPQLVDFDPQHLEFYEAVLKRFREWYIRMLEERGDDPQKFLTNELLVKLGYVVRAAIQPWAMKKVGEERLLDDTDEGEVEPFEFPEYPRAPTALHRWVIDHARETVEAGRQFIIGSRHGEALSVIAEALADLGVEMIDGTVSMAERSRIISRFQAGESAGVVGTMGTIAESYDFGRATVAYNLEPDWTPFVNDQFEGRITRGYLQETPTAYRMAFRGSIMELMWHQGGLKRRSVATGLDGATQNISGADILDVAAFCEQLVFDGKKVKKRAYTLQL